MVERWYGEVLVRKYGGMVKEGMVRVSVELIVLYGDGGIFGGIMIQWYCAWWCDCMTCSLV